MEKKKKTIPHTQGMHKFVCVVCKTEFSTKNTRWRGVTTHGPGENDKIYHICEDCRGPLDELIENGFVKKCNCWEWRCRRDHGE